ncbi:phenylacetate-coenzyme A ligase PaaK-like adenylate-forming protein [Psychromicrobium silvestre]|uniref:Phenylacetate-coenzyme A ligase PaaK-like adenylate-forming protein n=1 Tax=Psychromicrobium silvestre TaxID=1645614 RepID=A0A7Y9LVB6_9MICC|nr:hypothetical protein [Psychromicrobium silvestre]NYE96195.1 phenylacetate-coenzyme A ligase PaaK-like adenylate-forming protein [Psychromicrobium silvestre]
MGLFDRAKNAFGGGTDDWAAQAKAAQELAGQHLRDAGYTDGSAVTMANAGQVSGQMQADHDVLNAYGQELNRIIAIGATGSSVVTDLVDTGDRTAGNPWYELEVQVTLPGAEPYTVRKREMVPAQFLANYAVGTTHEVKVDPADPKSIALTS